MFLCGGVLLTRERDVHLRVLRAVSDRTPNITRIFDAGLPSAPTTRGKYDGHLSFRRPAGTTEALVAQRRVCDRTAYVLGIAVLLLVFSKYMKNQDG